MHSFDFSFDFSLATCRCIVLVQLFNIDFGFNCTALISASQTLGTGFTFELLILAFQPMQTSRCISNRLRF